MLPMMLVISFLIGSIPFGIIFAKAKGVDIRKTGSGNIGATNVLRSVGKREAALTLAADAGKGLLPVLVARHFMDSEIGIGLVGFAAVAGHVFSVFLRFRGGKGVATAIGAISVYYPPAGLAVVVVWIASFALTRISSAGAIISFLLLPIITHFLGGGKEKVLIIFLISLLIIIRHKDNIERIAKGEESRIARKE